MTGLPGERSQENKRRQGQECQVASATCASKTPLQCPCSYPEVISMRKAATATARSTEKTPPTSWQLSNPLTLFMVNSFWRACWRIYLSADRLTD